MFGFRSGLRNMKKKFFFSPTILYSQFSLCLYQEECINCFLTKASACKMNVLKHYADFGTGMFFRIMCFKRRHYNLAKLTAQSDNFLSRL